MDFLKTTFRTRVLVVYPCSISWTHLDIRNLWQHDVWMRTTLTLDPDVAKLVRETVETEQLSLKDVINDALRKGLKPSESRPAFRVVAHSSPLQPGLDPRGFNQLADELEDEAVLSKRPIETR